MYKRGEKILVEADEIPFFSKGSRLSFAASLIIRGHKALERQVDMKLKIVIFSFGFGPARTARRRRRHKLLL
jgi:hypothetical protein